MVEVAGDRGRGDAEQIGDLAGAQPACQRRNAIFCSTGGMLRVTSLSRRMASEVRASPGVSGSGLLNQVLAQLAVLAGEPPHGDGVHASGHRLVAVVDLIAPEPADYHGRDLSTVTVQETFDVRPTS